jgi:UDP-2-acetamido-3-amino-2,3-dideoxy-glucuronate N-acetyltransferase
LQLDGSGGEGIITEPRGSLVRIHPTAIIESGVEIGDHSSVWDNVHIRRNTRLGQHTTVGEKTYIAYDVVIGSHVKINAFVYICTGVTIEDMCMISAGTVFTNDRFPRSMNKELTGLETSEPTDETLHMTVKRGSTIGANATIGPGVTLGEFSMVGMGSVVTRNVPPHGLVVGNPAALIGYVCVCGPRLVSVGQPPAPGAEVECDRCGRKYDWDGRSIHPKDAAS